MPSRRPLLVAKVLRHHGPLTDEQLAWWLGHFGLTAAAAVRARYTAVRRGLVRYARRVRETRAKRLARVWEAV